MTKTRPQKKVQFSNWVSSIAAMITLMASLDSSYVA
jgi:hypothetical protein